MTKHYINADHLPFNMQFIHDCIPVLGYVFLRPDFKHSLEDMKIWQNVTQTGFELNEQQEPYSYKGLIDFTTANQASGNRIKPISLYVSTYRWNDSKWEASREKQQR